LGPHGADFDALLLDFLSTICAAAAANAKRSFEIVAEVPGEMIEGIAPPMLARDTERTEPRLLLK
jgi:hypothetical protein